MTGAQLVVLMGGRDRQWLAITPAASVKATDMLGVVRGLEAYSVMQFQVRGALLG